MMMLSVVRGVNHSEIWLFKGTSEAGMDEVHFNTSALNDSGDKLVICPDGPLGKAAVKSAMSQYHVTAAYRNGPQGRAMDTARFPVGPAVCDATGNRAMKRPAT